jgi:hypothetical protein
MNKDIKILIGIIIFIILFYGAIFFAFGSNVGLIAICITMGLLLFGAILGS